MAKRMTSTQDNAYPPTAWQPAQGSRGVNRRRRVLIVDDIASNRLMLQLFLEQRGFSTDNACGGEEAIHLAAQTRYDAILMDLQMPVIDGYTAAQRIRASESGSIHTVIVAVTAATENDTREKCLAAGMDGHFMKPLDLARFFTELLSLMTARAVGESLRARADRKDMPPHGARHSPVR